MILKIAVCDDNDKDIEIINRELLLLEEKAREKGCTYQIQAFKSGNDILKSFALVQDMHICFWILICQESMEWRLRKGWSRQNAV